MKLATIRLDGQTRAVRVDPDTLVDLGVPDLGAWLALPDWAEKAVAVSAKSAVTYPPDQANFAPLITTPSKVVCVGLNYRTHIQEMGRDLPTYPTLFTKFADSLLGANDDICRPDETEKLDWEAELAVIVGSPARRASGLDAGNAIAGFTLLNDITCRDWQFRTREWLQGKAWDSSTPVGPYLVTPDELPGGVRPDLRLHLKVNEQTKQDARTSDLLFDPVALVEYVSTIVRLRPGDIIATGTPGGVGHARTPPQFLASGDNITLDAEGLGRQQNTIVAGDPT